MTGSELIELRRVLARRLWGRILCLTLGMAAVMWLFEVFVLTLKPAWIKYFDSVFFSVYGILAGYSYRRWSSLKKKD